MTTPRRSLVSLEHTPFYHCIGRCVRRAFLCGRDAATGRNYEHRREWMRQRLALLTRTFAIDLCAYALMNNHYHLVVRLGPERTTPWSDQEVIERWTRLFNAPALIQRYVRGEVLNEAEEQQRQELVALWRNRLGDLSWFMRCLNEYIARRANAEDGCKGHFWEARFRSQALLDDVALLQGMVYVDLNPVRAAIANNIERSDYTAAQQRLLELIGIEHGNARLPKLVPLHTTDAPEDGDALPFSLTDYLELAEATGRCCVHGKAGIIDADQPALLRRLGIDPASWLQRMRAGNGSDRVAIGAPEALRRFARHMARCWLQRCETAARLYPA